MEATPFSAAASSVEGRYLLVPDYPPCRPKKLQDYDEVHQIVLNAETERGWWCWCVFGLAELPAPDSHFNDGTPKSMVRGFKKKMAFFTTHDEARAWLGQLSSAERARCCDPGHDDAAADAYMGKYGWIWNQDRKRYTMG